MKKFKGMMIEEVIKELEEMGEEFEVERDDNDSVCWVMVGEYYDDHVDLEVEAGKVIDVDFYEWD